MTFAWQAAAWVVVPLAAIVLFDLWQRARLRRAAAQNRLETARAIVDYALDHAGLTGHIHVELREVQPHEALGACPICRTRRIFPARRTADDARVLVCAQGHEFGPAQRRPYQ